MKADQRGFAQSIKKKKNWQIIDNVLDVLAKLYSQLILTKLKKKLKKKNLK